MAISLKFYSDAALTTEVNMASPVAMAALASGSDDVQLWLGSTASGMQFQATSDPGVDDLVIDIVDTGAGTGQADTAAKLATTQGGLATATAGASLSVGPNLSSGVANAFAFWLRMTDGTATAGTYTDIKLLVDGVTELAGD